MFGAYGEVLHATVRGAALRVSVFEHAEHHHARASDARMCAVAGVLTVLASAVVCGGEEEVMRWGGRGGSPGPPRHIL